MSPKLLVKGRGLGFRGGGLSVNEVYETTIRQPTVAADKLVLFGLKVCCIHLVGRFHKAVGKWSHK